MYKASVTSSNFNYTGLGGNLDGRNAGLPGRHTLAQSVKAKYKNVQQKIDFFTPTAIDSIPIDNKFNSMLHRKNLPNGKQLPPAVAATLINPDVKPLAPPHPYLPNSTMINFKQTLHMHSLNIDAPPEPLIQHHHHHHRAHHHSKHHSGEREPSPKDESFGR